MSEPARTTVGVTGLARGGIIEIEMIACRPPGG
jgi:enamine deaminase RidA (YjgF/YER057c/UK114 family)